MADELPALANTLKRPRSPEMGDIEKMSEMAAVTGYYTLDDLLDSTEPERDLPYNLL